MKRLKHRYRLVILQDTDLAEKASFSIKGLNVVAFLSVVLLITFFIFWGLFSYTPLVNLLPVSDHLKKEQQLSQLARKADSLNEVIQQQQTYFENVKTILKGDVPESDKSRMTNSRDTLKARSNPLQASAKVNADSLLKGPPTAGEDLRLLPEATEVPKAFALEAINFFPPLKGVVTNGFDPGKGHYAVDVVAPADTRIKAAKAGTVIYTGWSAKTGHTLVLQHHHNTLSVYKHNSELLKDIGSFVETGEAIGVVGTSGELSTGPHLHFELWKGGSPLNPTRYIEFK